MDYNSDFMVAAGEGAGVAIVNSLADMAAKSSDEAEDRKKTSDSFLAG